MELKQRKSRFRGVYDSGGKRWKSQLQSNGIQYYLGTFETEVEAAKAYDEKARQVRGSDAQTNFGPNGQETDICQIRSFMEEDHAPPGPKFETPLQLIVDHTNLIRVLWERSLAISQRLELAHKELVRLRSLGLWTTEGAQLRLTYSLEDEIHRMGAVKPQLEAALAQAILERSLRESQRKGPGHGKRTHGDVHWNQEESPSVTWQCTVVRQITAMSPSGLGGGFVVAESTPAQCPHVHQREANDSGECHILSSHFNFEGEG